MSDLTLITPTGDRHEMFQLCERWMRRQTFSGSVQWIVVDDGQYPTECSAGQQYIRVKRSRHPTAITMKNHTLGDNLQRALPLVESDKVLVIEDDDYYGPHYLETYFRWLDQAPLAGEAGSKYYRLDNRTWQHFDTPPFRVMAALARTGFRRELFPLVERCCSGDSQVDARIWKRHQGPKHLQQPSISGLHVSIKGGPGRRGHTHGRALTHHDPHLTQLLEWTRGDWRAVLEYTRLTRRSNLLVYTAVTRSRKRHVPYSPLTKPVSRPPDVRFVCFTDMPSLSVPGWEMRHEHLEIERQQPDRWDLQSRYWKILSHRWFPTHQWTLYVDASMQLRFDPHRILHIGLSRFGDFEFAAIEHPYQKPNRLWDVMHECRWVRREQHAPHDLITRQADDYLEAGFGGLKCYQCCLMLRRNTTAVARLNELWWEQIMKYGHRRDQPSFPVAAHLAGVQINAFSHSEGRRLFTRHVGHSMQRPQY